MENKTLKEILEDPDKAIEYTIQILQELSEFDAKMGGTAIEVFYKKYYAYRPPGMASKIGNCIDALKRIS